MPIPRPKNLEPVKFRDGNWIAQDDFHGQFYEGYLRLPTFLNILFQHPQLETDLDDQVPWDFLLRPSHIQSSLAGSDDHQWEPVRILGAGNFGRVGLWRKRENSETIDEIAIKEANRLPSYMGYECERDGIEEGLAMEAAINADLNSQPDSEHISFLRSFRFYPGLKPDQHGNFRFYFNFCPYDNLDTIARRYRMWDEWLPEAFIWHLLIQLTKGLQTLEQPHPDDTLMEKPINTPSWVIHCDLKPANVLLDYASEQRKNADVGKDGIEPMDFPEIRISDFGLSVYTNENEIDNPMSFTEGGTDGYKPPEQTQHKDNWGVDFESPPSTTRDGFTKAHNIWCVGKIIYDVMTLESPGTLDRLRKATTEDDYVANQNHFIGGLWGTQKYWASMATTEQHRLNAYDKYKLDPPRTTRAQTERQKDSNVEAAHVAAPSNTTAPSKAAGTSNITAPSKATGSSKITAAEAKAANKMEADKAKAYVEEEWRVREEVHQKKREEEKAKQKANDIEKSGWRRNQYTAMSTHWHYSKPLTELVWQMLDPNPYCRPPSSEILKTATENLEALVQKSRSLEQDQNQSKATPAQSLPNKTKLYFRANEINEMSRGKGNYEPSDAEYYYLVGKCDPDWAPLNPPREKWQPHEKSLGPLAPHVDVYERPGRIRDALIRLRGPDLESSRTSPRATDAYEGLDHLELAREVARRAEADDVEAEAQGLMKANSRDQLIDRLKRLDQKSAHTSQRKRTSESSLPLASTTPSPKRPLEGAGDDGAPKKKRDKGKGKARDVEVEIVEDPDMYGATSADDNDSADVDERQPSPDKGPGGRTKKAGQGRRGKAASKAQPPSVPALSGGRPKRAAKEAANKKILAKPTKPPTRGAQSTKTQPPRQNEDEQHDDDDDDVAEDQEQQDQTKKRGRPKTTAKTTKKAPAKPPAKKAPAKAPAKKQARGGKENQSGKGKGRATTATKGGNKGGAKGGGVRGGVGKGDGVGKGKKKA